MLIDQRSEIQTIHYMIELSKGKSLTDIKLLSKKEIKRLRKLADNAIKEMFDDQT